LFHNSNVFGSCIIQILYTGVLKFKKNNSGAKRLKLAKVRGETLQMVNAAYGDQSLPHRKTFRDGREDIEYDPRSGRCTECRKANIVDKISQLLLQNCHLSLRMLEDEVNIGKDTVRKISVEDL